MLVDLDEDGEEELVVIRPISSGDQIKIYKRAKETGNFECIYSYEKKRQSFVMRFMVVPLCGENALVIGHRKGNRDLLCFFL